MDMKATIHADVATKAGDIVGMDGAAVIQLKWGAPLVGHGVGSVDPLNQVPALPSRDVPAALDVPELVAHVGPSGHFPVVVQVMTGSRKWSHTAFTSNKNVAMMTKNTKKIVAMMAKNTTHTGAVMSMIARFHGVLDADRQQVLR